MSKLLQTLTLASITCFAFSSATVAQDKKSDKLGEYDEIVIKRNSNKDGKVTIEIKDGNVLVDGEKMDAYKDGDISVYRRRIRPVDGNNFNFAPRGGVQLFNDDDDDDTAGGMMDIKPGKAVLGVFTEKKEAAGATVRDVAKESPAEKAGIKAGDVITRVDADKISEPQDLFEKIGAHDPGDKVTITYLRDKKEYTATVTLDERKDAGTLELFPRGGAQGFRRAPRGEFNFGDNFPGGPNRFRGFNEDNDAKLGLSVQDTEDGNGAEVLSVTPGSAAEKAGFKAKDIITELAGDDVNSTRDVANAYRANKNKGTITAQVKRGGQQKTLEVKVPKKLHKADL
ncbi:PDZ domain-containing protein [Chitinophaga filiformis]|uniref:PDZ domain-containing protein n=1 Tax=Chitinophaga filiformis TaxID=104663 RepID=UPI001F3D2588|nr:PDZ domain-containing protein [Chitinophaga filiformis]MCF6401598.1 PDZ domain-containing protein [Chitinophaga filiformis]